MKIINTTNIKCRVPWNKGRPWPIEQRQKISASMKGLSPWNKGKRGEYKLSDEHRKKLGESRLGFRHSEETKNNMRGEKSVHWIKDRTKLKRHNRRNDMAYKDWRKQVWLRDNFKCKIANPDCAGRIEAHHILSWREYPELHYQLNNGITLCHAHHPRKRAEEKRLQSAFQALVSVSKV